MQESQLQVSRLYGRAFWVRDGLTVLASTDFSGDVDLEVFSEPVHIAFKYVGSGPGGQTTSYRVDDVKVREK